MQVTLFPNPVYFSRLQFDLLGSNFVTVKLVYKDHPMDQQNVVLIHRWSLYAGSIMRKVYPGDL